MPDNLLLILIGVLVLMVCTFRHPLHTQQSHRNHVKTLRTPLAQVGLHRPEWQKPAINPTCSVVVALPDAHSI